MDGSDEWEITATLNFVSTSAWSPMIQKTGSALVALSVHVILFCPSMAIYAFFYLVLVNPRKRLSLSDCLLDAHVRCFHVSAESTQNHPTVAQSPTLFLQSTASLAYLWSNPSNQLRYQYSTMIQVYVYKPSFTSNIGIKRETKLVPSHNNTSEDVNKQ